MLKKIKANLMNIRQKILGGSTKILVNNTVVKPVHRISQDISNWRTAIQQAEGYSQQRALLLDLFADIILDGELTATMGKRVNRIKNKKLAFTKKDGTIVEDVSDLSKKSFFGEFLEEVLNSIFYGHSLIELYWPAAGSDEKGQTILIPRKNVKPRWGIVTKNEWDMHGVDYRSDIFKDKVIEVGGPEDLGLLMKVAQYVIYKRGNFGDWAEFNEIFGIPFRWATYNNEQSRKVLEDALEKAGSAGYVVAPEDASLQFLNGNAGGQGGQVFKDLRKACNEEIALTILHNTMTTLESSSSGYAQSKTHADSEDELTAADRLFVLRVLNEQLIPYLEKMGYDVSDGEWSFQEEQNIPLQEKIDIDLKVSTKVPVGNSYWYETYGIPKPKSGDLPEPTKDDDKPGAAPKSTQKKNLSLSEKVANFYVHHGGCQCESCLTLSDLPEASFSKIPRNLEKLLADRIFNGNYDISPELHKQYYSRFRKFVRSGFARSLAEAGDFDDFTLQQGILRNISEFAAVKQNALIDELIGVSNLPLVDYKKAARQILQRHNIQYLQTELITFETAAHTASQWKDFIDRSDLYPNLKFETVGDDRVRPGHRQLDGAIYPVNDPFWDTHTPPLDWRCRCILIQTDEEVITAPTQNVRKGFGLNPYKQKRLIGNDHPYFGIAENDLADLLMQAETIRAEIERAGMAKRAQKQLKKGVELDGKTISANVKDLLQSESDQMAIRNAIIASIAVVLEELTKAGIDADTQFDIYQLSILDTTFRLLFEAKESEYILQEAFAI